MIDEIEIKIGSNRYIGSNHPCFIIAEAGVNHNGDLIRALEMVDIAADAGADAIKFQTFVTEKIITTDAPKSTYHINSTGDDSIQSWFDLLKSQEMSKKMHVELMNKCKQRGILFMSTPYDCDSVDLLNNLGIDIYKIASTDANNKLLLEKIASKKKPVILSTAMSNLDEIKESIEYLKTHGASDVIVLQCTGNYPCPDSEANLKAINFLKERFGLITGFSDHVSGIYSAVSAISLGAKVYEKHFTISRGLPGPDHMASIEPGELKELVYAIKSTERMLGDGKKRVMPCEFENRRKLRKYLVAEHEIKKGQIISKQDLAALRTGGIGFAANGIESIIGRTASETIAKGQPLIDNLFY